MFYDRSVFFAVTFRGLADFSSTDENFQNIEKISFVYSSFETPPDFFGRKCTGYIDWLRSKFPSAPTNDAEASWYINYYDQLALLMADLKKYDDEHMFFRLSMQAKEVRDWPDITAIGSWLYGRLFDYGWSIGRAATWWALHIFVCAVGIMELSRSRGVLPFNLESLGKSFGLSFANAHSFFGINRGPLKATYKLFEGEGLFDLIWNVQLVVGTILLFFLLLAIRNRFRLK